MAYRREMYPDLVRSSRLNLYLKQGKLAVSALNLPCHLPVRDRLAPWPALRAKSRCHARATDHIAANSRIDGSFCHFGPAVHQRDISLFDLTTCKLLCQLSVGEIRFSHQHQPAGFFLQPMDDPRP